MKVTITRLRELAKIPFKKHVNDAGYDLYWAPSNTHETSPLIQWEGKSYFHAIMIPAHSSRRFETGLKVNFPHGHCLEIKNRSGIASKKDLIVGACIVDSTYTGEIFIDLHNVSAQPQIVEIGERIAQFVIYEVQNCIFEEVTSDQYTELFPSDRGENGFGSTGVK